MPGEITDITFPCCTKHDCGASKIAQTCAIHLDQLLDQHCSK